MYRGFNLKTTFNQTEIDDFYKIGLDIFEKKKTTTRAKLEDLILTNGNFDGTKMQGNWFPNVEADVFISHSHNDEKQAITLAGILKNQLNLNSFIDSCIWGYSNDLLKLLDEEFCKKKDGYYDYHKRNYSTSHVHMMLSTALNMMIDNTECLFFLNTPESISTTAAINSTLSPWIYAEITMSNLVRKKKKEQSRRNFSEISKGLDDELNENIQYEVSLGHLQEINKNDLFDWFNSCKSINQRNTFPLDVLYNQF